MTLTAPAPARPDLPDTVHGIKNLDPCTIQCDGCGVLDIGDHRVALTIILSPIRFNPHARALHGDTRRMCPDCWASTDTPGGTP